MNRFLLALLLTTSALAQSVSINGVPNQTFVGPSGTAQYIAPQAIAGCGVEYVSGLTYTVGACTYSINGVTYNSPLSSITLPAADATNPEIDVIYVDTTGVVQVIQGTPAVTPQQPVVDPSTQLQLTFVLVPATATTPANTTTVLIFDEGTEWTAAKGGTSSANVNLASTNNPYHGTIDTEFGAGGTVASTTYAQYTKPSSGTVTLGSYNSLILYLRNKAAWPKTRSVTVQWYNGSTPLGTAVVLSNGAYGLDATGNTSTYQQITIPTSVFGIAGTAATTVRFTVSGSSSSLTGFYLDEISLQGGNGGVSLPSTLMNYRGAWSSTTTYAPNDTVVSGGIGYVAIAASTNQAVGNATYWTPLATAGGSGTVTSFAAPSGSWPSWLVPTVTNSTTTPSLAVAASAIPNSALATQTANTVLGALTATTPSGLAVPSCSGASNALTWTTGTGFGCNTISGGGGGGTVFCPVNAQTGTTYTLVIGDGTATGSACIGTVTMTNASNNTVTVPPHSSVALPTPDEIDLIQLGAGQTCFVAGAGVTLTTPTSLCARAQNSTIGIRQIASDTWVVFGDTQ